MKGIAISILFLGLAFVLNSWILRLFYPGVEHNWQEYISFVKMRSKIYEIMFAGFFLIVAIISENDKIVKSVSTFFAILAISSVLDKITFNITRFLVTDIILMIIAATTVYFKVYKR